MRDLAGRVAFITGGASGIGLATARLLAQKGVSVAIADIEETALEEAEAELSTLGPVMPIRCDVRLLEDVRAAAGATIGRFGGVHVVFNNAGVVATGRVEDISPEAWHWVLDVNLWGVINGCQVFTPILKASGQPGHVVNTASMAGLTSGPLMAPYFVSKFGVVALSEALWYEARLDGSQLGVSVLCPGFVRTRIHEANRNRPQNVPSSEAGESGVDFLQLLAAGVEGGKSADDVAAAIIDAVETDRFWILPHREESLGPIKERTEAIIDGKSPRLIEWLAPPTVPDATR